MKKTIISLLCLFFLSAVLPTILFADGCTKDDVSKAVNEAAAILEKEGKAGLEKVGNMKFCMNNYIFVNDFDGKTLMHAKRHLIGKILIGLKDDTGKRFFADFTKTAQSSKSKVKEITYFNGDGWVSYRWPKPGKKAFSPKISYIKGCLMGNENVYVGSGIYE